MLTKQRAPAMRHVARTHRLDLDWLFQRVEQDPSIHPKYANTKEMIADMLTEGLFTASQWSVLCKMGNIGMWSTKTARGEIKSKQDGSDKTDQDEDQLKDMDDKTIPKTKATTKSKSRQRSKLRTARCSVVHRAARRGAVRRSAAWRSMHSARNAEQYT